MEFLIEINKKIYDISSMVTSVSYSDQLNDGCSKLEFSFVGDDLDIKNGSVVRFKYNSNNIFFGYVFKYSRSKKKEISVTAYDQLRYCKAKDSIVLNKDTVTTLVKKMCNYFNLKVGKITDTKYVLSTDIHDDKTWLDIIYSGISDTLTNKGEWYVLRDEFGAITVKELKELQLDLILGDGSLAYDFNYEKSIDDNYYNFIKLLVDNETISKRVVYTSKDNDAINSYGAMQYYEKLDKSVNASQAKAKAETLLKLYNRELETMSLECIGDSRVRAGTSFYTYVSEVGVNKRLLVKSVTHKFLPTHTMSMEVAI